MNQKVYMVNNFNCCIETERLLKVTGSQCAAKVIIRCILEIVQKVETRCYYRPLIRSNVRPTESHQFWWPWVTVNVIHLWQVFSNAIFVRHMLPLWHSTSRGPWQQHSATLYIVSPGPDWPTMKHLSSHFFSTYVFMATWNSRKLK